MGSLQLLKENEKQRKEIAAVERNNVKLQRSIISQRRDRFGRICGSYNLQIAFRDACFGVWKLLSRRRKQRYKMAAMMFEAAYIPIDKIIFEKWIEYVRAIKSKELCAHRREYRIMEETITRVEAHLAEALAHRVEMEEKISRLQQEKGCIESRLRIEQSQNAQLGNASKVDKQKLEFERSQQIVKINALQDMEYEINWLQADNERKDNIIRHLENAERGKMARYRIRTLKQIRASNMLIMREVLQDWRLIVRHRASSLIKSLNEYATGVTSRVTMLEQDLTDTQFQLHQNQHDSTEVAIRCEQVEELNETLESDLTAYNNSRGLKSFFELMNLPGLVCSLLRRIILITNRKNPPSLRYLVSLSPEQEASELKEVLNTYMCTHRKGKVSTRHEFQGYFERLALPGIAPAQVSQILTNLLDLDFSHAVSTCEIQKKICGSLSNEASDRMTDTWRTSWNGRAEKIRAAINGPRLMETARSLSRLSQTSQSRIESSRQKGQVSTMTSIENTPITPRRQSLSARSSVQERMSIRRFSSGSVGLAGLLNGDNDSRDTLSNEGSDAEDDDMTKRPSLSRVIGPPLSAR